MESPHEQRPAGLGGEVLDAGTIGEARHRGEHEIPAAEVGSLDFPGDRPVGLGGGIEDARVDGIGAGRHLHRHLQHCGTTRRSLHDVHGLLVVADHGAERIHHVVEHRNGRVVAVPGDGVGIEFEYRGHVGVASVRAEEREAGVSNPDSGLKTRIGPRPECVQDRLAGAVRVEQRPRFRPEKILHVGEFAIRVQVEVDLAGPEDLPRPRPRDGGFDLLVPDEPHSEVRVAEFEFKPVGKAAVGVGNVAEFHPAARAAAHAAHAAAAATAAGARSSATTSDGVLAGGAGRGSRTARAGRSASGPLAVIGRSEEEHYERHVRPRTRPAPRPELIVGLLPPVVELVLGAIRIVRVLAAARPEVLLELVALVAREVLEGLPLLRGHDRLDLFQPAPVTPAQVVLAEDGEREGEDRNRGDTRHKKRKAGGDPRLVRHEAS